MRDLTLDLLRRTAKTIEFSEKQALMMEGKESQTLSPESVNRIQDSRHRNKSAKKTSDVMCYACGRRGHMKRDPNCPARNCHITIVENKDILRRCAKVKSQVVHQGRKDNNKVLELLTLSVMSSPQSNNNKAPKYQHAFYLGGKNT